MFIHKSAVDEKSQSGGWKSICNNFNGIKRLASTGSLCHTSGSIQKSIMHQHMKTRKCRGKEEIREEKCQKAEPQAASSSPPGIRQSVSLCAQVCMCVCVSLGEKKHIPTHSIPWFNRVCTRRGLEREKKSDRERALFQRKRERRDMEKRENHASKEDAMRECFFIHSSPLCCNAPFSWCSGSALRMQGCLASGWGEVGSLEVFLLLTASAHQDTSVKVKLNQQCLWDDVWLPQTLSSLVLVFYSKKQKSGLHWETYNGSE